MTASSSTNAKAAIFASIRESLAASKPFDADWQKHHGHDAAAIKPFYTELSRETLIENFRTNLESVGGQCTLVASETEAAAQVEGVIRKLSAKKIAVSDSELVKNIVRSIDGLEIVENAPVEYLFDSDLGITSAQWAIAETGTLVLESRLESHRLTSLVPPVHVCVIKAGNIRQRLGEILELASNDLSRVVTFITGASRTSDIELTLAIGVHGPGELHVIVIAN